MSFISAIAGVFNPFSEDFSLVGVVFLGGGATLSASVPLAIKNAGKVASLVICDHVKEEKTQTCVEYIDKVTEYLVYSSTAVAVVGEIYLLNLVLH